MSKITGNQLPTTLNLPAIAPAFNWDFRNGKFLDSRQSFTRASTATRLNELDVLVSEAANVPRFHHLSGVSRGLLIEKSITNLYINSETFVGVATRTTVNTNVTTAPDGTLADEMVETVDTEEHFANDRNIAVTAGDSLFYSFYIKQTATTENRRFLLRLASALTANVYFDFVTKTITLTSGANYVSSSVVELANGWFYIIIRATAASTGTVIARAQFAKADNSLIYAGSTNEKIAIWGGHFSISTGEGNSYIKTAGTPVTRALDLLTVSSANFSTIWRSDAYSIFTVFRGQVAGTCTIFDFNDGTANNRIYLESISGSLTFTIITDGVTQCSLSLGNVVSGTEYKVAAAWKLNDVAASINGATVITNTSTTLPTLTTMNIGSNYAGANQMNSALAFISGYAARLTNAELQGLSA